VNTRGPSDEETGRVHSLPVLTRCGAGHTLASWSYWTRMLRSGNLLTGSPFVFPGPRGSTSPRPWRRSTRHCPTVASAHTSRILSNMARDLAYSVKPIDFHYQLTTTSSQSFLRAENPAPQLPVPCVDDRCCRAALLAFVPAPAHSTTTDTAEQPHILWSRCRCPALACSQRSIWLAVAWKGW
jgi:hypothetical protein